MKSKLAFVRQPDSIPRKTAFSLRCFAAILLRLPPESEAHSTPFQGGEQNRIRFQTVHQEQSCWAVFLFGGDAYSVSAFQNYLCIIALHDNVAECIHRNRDGGFALSAARLEGDGLGIHSGASCGGVMRIGGFTAIRRISGYCIAATLGQYRIILSADTASEVPQPPERCLSR